MAILLDEIVADGNDVKRYCDSSLSSWPVSNAGES